MSKGIELELYYAVAATHLTYRSLVGKFIGNDKTTIYFTIDFDVNKNPIIELASDPIYKIDNPEQDKKLAIHAANIANIIATSIQNTDQDTLTLEDIFKQNSQLLDGKFISITPTALDCKQGKTYLQQNKDMLAHLQVNFSVKSHQLSTPETIRHFISLSEKEVMGFNIHDNFAQAFKKAYTFKNYTTSYWKTPRALKKHIGIKFNIEYMNQVDKNLPSTSITSKNPLQPLNKENWGPKDPYGVMLKTVETSGFFSKKDLATEAYIQKTIMAGERISGKQTNEDDPKETKPDNKDLRRNFIFETRSIPFGANYDLTTLKEHIYDKLRKCSLETMPTALISYFKECLENKNYQRCAEVFAYLHYIESPKVAFDLLELIKPEEASLIYPLIHQQQITYLARTREDINYNDLILQKLLNDSSVKEKYDAITTLLLNDNIEPIKTILDEDQALDLNNFLLLCCDLDKNEMIYYLLNNHDEQFNPILPFKGHENALSLLAKNNNYEALFDVLDRFDKQRRTMLSITIKSFKNDEAIMKSFIQFTDELYQAKNFDMCFDVLIQLGHLKARGIPIKFNNPELNILLLQLDFLSQIQFLAASQVVNEPFLNSLKDIFIERQEGYNNPEDITKDYEEVIKLIKANEYRPQPTTFSLLRPFLEPATKLVQESEQNLNQLKLEF